MRVADALAHFPPATAPVKCVDVWLWCVEGAITGIGTSAENARAEAFDTLVESAEGVGIEDFDGMLEELAGGDPVLVRLGSNDTTVERLAVLGLASSGRVLRTLHELEQRRGAR